MCMVSSPDMQKVVQQIFKATHEILLPEKDPKLDVKSHVIKAKAPASKFESKNKIVGMMCRFEFLEVIIRIAKARFCISGGEDIDPEADNISEGL